MRKKLCSTMKLKKRVFNQEDWIDTGTSHIEYLLCTNKLDCKHNSVTNFDQKSESKNVETLALIDSGVGRKFINLRYTKQLELLIQLLKKPVTAQNVDGTINSSRTIISDVNLLVEIDRWTMNVQLLATELGGQKIILGFPWLNEHNPDINWQTDEFKWQTLWPLKVKRYHDKPAPQKGKL